MAKPRPRSPYYKIIDKAELKTPWRYFLEESITLAFWAIWVYWIYPVLTVLLWVMGVRIIYTELFPTGGFAELISLLKQAGFIFLVIMAIILTWSYYNYLWFLRRGERRDKKVLICYDEDLAKFYKIDANLLREAKKYNQIEVDLRNKKIEIRLPFGQT